MKVMSGMCLRKWHYLYISLLATLIAGCISGNQENDPVDITLDILANEDFVGPYSVGQPYTVNSVYYVPKENFAYEMTGRAWSYEGLFSGNRTANGELFDANAMTAAHTTLPFSTVVRVVNINNRRSVIVRINDRGPFLNNATRKDAGILLTDAAANQLGIREGNSANVLVTVLVNETRDLMAQVGSQGREGLKTGDAGTAINLTQPVDNGSINTASTSTDDAGYYVRTAVYSNRDEAFAMAQRLVQYGNTRVIADNQGYRVYLGPSSEAEALDNMVSVVGEGAQGATVIQR